MRASIPVALLLVAACGGGDPEPPSYHHAYPDEAANQTCVICHACGSDGVITEVAPTVSREHAVCADCHATDPATHVCDVSCDWQKSCQDQPSANCAECHRSNAPKKNIAEVNDRCRRCHHKE